MKAWRWILSLAAVFVICLPLKAHAIDAQDFIINSFNAQYYLSRDSNGASNLKVVEAITATFPDFDQNHGILRAIPEVYQDHTLSLKIDSVKDQDGAFLSYTSYQQNDNLVLKIGLPDVYVHGQKVYVISYSIKDAVTIRQDSQSFYWNVNGTQWPQKFGKVEAQVHISSELFRKIGAEPACFSGNIGSVDTGGCRLSEATTDNDKTFLFTVDALDPYQTLSFNLPFNNGTFVLGPEVAHEKFIKKIELITGIALGIILPAGVLIFMFLKWRKYGDDPKGRGVIIPEYEPPKGLDVLYSGFLLKQGLESKSISAALIEMAVKRHIIIYETPKKGWFGKNDYELELKNVPKDVLEDTKEALELIFGSLLNLENGIRVRLSDLKQSAKRRVLAEQMKDLEKKLSLDMKTLGYFSNNPIKTRQLYSVIGFIVLLIGGGILWVDSKIEPATAAHLYYLFIPPGIGLIISGLITILFSKIMPARSQLGVDTHDHLLGLKDYIKLAEADRLKFLQSPEGAEKIEAGTYDPKDPKMQVKLFESLLPYAMLFGIEKDWAKQFADIYKSPPDWYQGNWATFNAAYLASSVGGFSSASNAAFSAPSGGGAGGAGGGGGGGGGGGW